MSAKKPVAQEIENFDMFASPLNAQVEGGDPRSKFGAKVKKIAPFEPSDPLGFLPGGE